MVFKYTVSKDNSGEDTERNKRLELKINAALLTVVILLACLVGVAVFLGLQIHFCGQEGREIKPTEKSITKELFGHFEGRNVYRYTLKNSNNVEVKILNYGGIITNIFAPDKNNNREDIVLGFDTFEGYLNNTPYFGALIGRYANRIAGGHFTLDGITYNLTKNDGPNALHGGIKGFNKKLWDATVVGSQLVLFYSSPDGEEHYPGQLNVTVTYELSHRNELIITYKAHTSKPTIINLTNHAYFNLAGQAAGTISDHLIRLEADYYLPVDITQIPIGDSLWTNFLPMSLKTLCISSDYKIRFRSQAAGTISDHLIRLEADYYLPVDITQIPIGILSDVSGSMFDLRSNTRLGDRIPKVPGNYGFDHNFCLEKPGWMKHAARVEHPSSGRALDVFTTEPGVQFYTAYHLQDQPGKGGIFYKRYGAFALEAQHYPDSPNEPTFPSTVLRPGQEYQQETIYHFSVESRKIREK